VRSAVIGFQTPFARWEPSLLPSHERYKIGWDLDLYLRVHQGIENRCMCKEGFSTQDQWRVIASDSFQPRVPWTVRFDGADLNWGERVAEDSGLILSRAGARIHGYFSNPPP